MDAVVRKKMLSLISKFQLQEIPEMVECIFNTFTWDDIKNAMIKDNLNLRKAKDLAPLILEEYQKSNPTSQDVQSVMWTTMFLDAIAHDSLTWNSIQLLNKCEEFPSDVEDLDRRIVREYRKEARDTEIILKLTDDIVWVMLVEKLITKKGIKHGKPFYIAANVDLEKQYLFYSPKLSSDDSGPLLLLAKAFGYESYKRIQFQGKDIKSMFNMVKRHAKPSTALVPYEPIRYRFDGNVHDFTQGLDRLAYAKAILPPGCTNLTELTVHSRNEWAGNFPLPGNPVITTQLRIRAKGRHTAVEDVLRAMITENLISIPAPEYITSLPSLDRNYLKLTQGKKTEYRAGSSSMD